jgi:hypothetical protein
MLLSLVCPIVYKYALEHCPYSSLSNTHTHTHTKTKLRTSQQPIKQCGFVYIMVLILVSLIQFT